MGILYLKKACKLGILYHRNRLDAQSYYGKQNDHSALYKSVLTSRKEFKKSAVELPMNGEWDKQ